MLIIFAASFLFLVIIILFYRFFSSIFGLAVKVFETCVFSDLSDKIDIII